MRFPLPSATGAAGPEHEQRRNPSELRDYRRLEASLWSSNGVIACYQLRCRPVGDHSLTFAARIQATPCGGRVRLVIKTSFRNPTRPNYPSRERK